MPIRQGEIPAKRGGPDKPKTGRAIGASFASLRAEVDVIGQAARVHTVAVRRLHPLRFLRRDLLWLTLCV